MSTDFVNVNEGYATHRDPSLQRIFLLSFVQNSNPLRLEYKLGELPIF
jgi:hypothetical protein